MTCKGFQADCVLHIAQFQERVTRAAAQAFIKQHEWRPAERSGAVGIQAADVASPGTGNQR